MSDQPIVKPIVPESWTASTNLNSSIKTFEDLAHRIKVRLGYPDLDVNVSDEAIASNINEALEVFSRYAGYDEEYLIFSDAVLANGCEVNLDHLINSCDWCQHETEDCSNYEIETVVTSTDVTENILGSGRSLIYRSVKPNSKEESEIINLPITEETYTTRLELSFDPEEPWTFDVSNAYKVLVLPLSSYPDMEIITPVLDAWVRIDDVYAEIYPPNWEDKNRCMTDYEWWTGLSGDDWTPKDATHVIITQVPFNTIGGIQPLELNTGKGATFIHCNGLAKSDEYVKAKVQFVNSYDLPEPLSGEFNVTDNNGFVLGLETDWCLEPNTPLPIPVSSVFVESLSSDNYGDILVHKRDFLDPSLGNQQRKIVDVFSVERGGSHNGELLFNFEFAFAQGMFGYDGLGNRFMRNGYDLVTYDISRQYMETVKKLFGQSEISFKFNKRTQVLKVFRSSFSPDTNTQPNTVFLLGLYLERTIEDMIPEMWVRDYATALTKITLGNTLTRFSGATTVGGLTINGTDIISQGIQEKTDLLAWIREQNSEGGLRVPFYME